MANEKYFELFRQAVNEKLPRVGGGGRSFLPNQVGSMMEHFKDLCEEHGIDPQTGELLDERKTK